MRQSKMLYRCAKAVKISVIPIQTKLDCRQQIYIADKGGDTTLGQLQCITGQHHRPASVIIAEKATTVYE